MKKQRDPMDEIFLNPALDLKHQHNGKAIACILMKNIMYDNGMVDRWTPESYPLCTINKIAEIAKPFFEKHPQLLTEENFDLIATGFADEVDEKFGSLPGFAELNNILNDYFNGDI